MTEIKLKHGNVRYQDWLKKLSAEELEEHTQARIARKNEKKLKRLLEEKIEMHAEELSQKIMDYAFSMIKNNVDNPVVFNALMDKLVGKDADKLDLTTNNVKLPAINISMKDTKS